MSSADILSFTSVSDSLIMMRTLLRTERQRLNWTQAELARRSGVPSATISRLELKGLGSTDAVCRILFAMNRLEALADFLKERQRLANLPVTLSEPFRTGPILRVRVRKVKK